MKTTTRWIGAVVTSVGVALGASPWEGEALAASAFAQEVPEAEAQESAATQAGPAKVLVLPVQLSGELPPDTAAEVAKLVADNLVDDGIAVERAQDLTLADCDDACRRAAAERSGAEFLVQAVVVGEEDEFTVTVTLFAGDTGEALVPFADECSICGFVEVRDMVRLKVLDARAEVIRRRREAVQVGDGPAPPVVVEGQTDRPLAPRSKLVPAGWGLVGAGAAATVGGVVLLALHQRSAGCLDNPRGGECVPLLYTTAPAGGAVLGVGVAAVIGGVVMVVLGRRAEQRAASGSASGGGARAASRTGARAVAVQPYGTGVQLRF